MSTNNSRKEAHLAAKQLLLKGSFSEALTLLQKAEVEHGPHIALTADIATCLYYSGAISAWNASVQRMDQDFKSVMPLLSPKMRYAAGLMLGKFREEQGLIHLALENYREIKDSLSPTAHSNFHHLCIAQLIRLQSTYGVKANLGEYYRCLIKLPLESDLFQDFDVQHALVLAEFRLVGLKLALQRLNAVLSNTQRRESEVSLLVLDLAELILRSNQDLPEELLNQIRAIHPQDEYERCLQQFSMTRELVVSPKILNHVSIAGSIRLLSLSALHSDEPTIQKNAIQLLLRDLSCSKSEDLWRDFLADLFRDKEAKVQKLLISNCDVIFEKSSFSLSTKPTMVKLLRAISRYQSISVEDAVKAIWESEFNESYFHRLRVLTNRLNLLIARELGPVKLLRVTKEKLLIRNGFEVVTKE